MNEMSGPMITIDEQLRKVIAEITALPANISGSADLYADLGVASIKAIQLLMAIEERFEISVPDDQFIEATSVDSLARLIERVKQC